MNELIELLISSVNDEWLSSLAYEVQASMLRGLWRDPIAEHLTEHAEEEEGHAEKITLHLAARGVDFEVQLPPLKIGKTIEEMLKIDIQLEIQAIDKYTRIIQLCEQSPELKDTQMMIETILADEVGHCDDHAAFLQTKIKSKEIDLKSASWLPMLQKVANKLDEVGRSEANNFDELIKNLVQF